MGNKEVLQKLFPLQNLGGDFNDLLTALGNELDSVQSRADDLLEEAFPDTTTELLSNWEKAYGLKPEDTDTISERRNLLLYKINELGGLSENYFYNLAFRLGIYITITAPTTFKVGISKIGDSLGSPFTWLIRMFEVTRHRFPFKVGISKIGDPLVTYDKRNSLEEIFLKIKPAHTDILFDRFNLGFEKGNFDYWIPNSYTSIDSVDTYEGSYSCKFETTVTSEGVISDPLHISPDRLTAIQSYHKLNFTGTGKFYVYIDLYSDTRGESLIESARIITYTESTAPVGWFSNISLFRPINKYISLFGAYPVPANARSFRVRQYVIATSGIVTANLDYVIIGIIS